MLFFQYSTEWEFSLSFPKPADLLHGIPTVGALLKPSPWLIGGKNSAPETWGAGQGEFYRKRLDGAVIA